MALPNIPYKRLVHVVGADFLERSCPRGLNCDAIPGTRDAVGKPLHAPYNMYCVVGSFFLYLVLFISFLFLTKNLSGSSHSL